MKCPYLKSCERMMKDYCEEVDAKSCFDYQRQFNAEIEMDRQRVLELYPIYMFDIYCARVINQGREKYARQKESKLFNFHDYVETSVFGGKK